MVLHKLKSSISACKTSLSNNFESNKTFINHNYLRTVSQLLLKKRKQNEIAFLYSSHSTCVDLYKFNTHVNSVLWDSKHFIQDIKHSIECSTNAQEFAQQCEKYFLKHIIPQYNLWKKYQSCAIPLFNANIKSKDTKWNIINNNLVENRPVLSAALIIWSGDGQ